MYNMAPIHNAAARGNLVEVRRLLNAGANINARHNEMTPLMYAASNGRANVIRHLINKGANARLKQAENNPRTALIFATEGGHVNAVRALIRHSNLNVQNGNGRTALTVAASLRYPEIVRMLVRAGARPNNETVQYLMNNNNMQNLLGSALVRRTIARRALTNRVRRAHIARRTHAMRGQLTYAPVQEGRRTVTGLPVGVRNLIAQMMRR